MSTVQNEPLGVAAPGSDDGAARTWPRHECELSGTCGPLTARSESGETWPGRVQNISLGGLGLVLSRRFEPGAVLSLELESPERGVPQRLLVRVVRVEALPGREWLLGCSLLSRLSHDKLKKLLGADRPAPPTKEAGDSAVQDVTFTATLRGNGVGTFRARRLHIAAGWPPAVGTVLTLGLNGNHRNAIRLQVRVCDCFRQGDGWVVHYELTEWPSVSALQVLRRPAR
jgi:hypothetical protein